MKPERVKDKSGRLGWRYRYKNPLRRKRTYKTFWFKSQRVADQAFRDFLEDLENQRLGLRARTDWSLPFTKLVDRFIAEAPISTADRREDLKRVLMQNHLKLGTIMDLRDPDKLTNKAGRLVASGAISSHFGRFSLQASLKQLTRWATGKGILPFNPLLGWRPLSWDGHEKECRAFRPEEFRAVMDASAELDGLLARRFPSPIVFRTILVSGNRPSAVLRAKVKDLREGRIILPPGKGKKRNGRAQLTEEFCQELHGYLKLRGDSPSLTDPLLVSHRGCEIERNNLASDFKRAIYLAAVKACWPAEVEVPAGIEPAAVADLLYLGKSRGFDGAPPKDPRKIAIRREMTQALKTLAESMRNQVDLWVSGLTLYSLRATHRTWARCLRVPVEAINLQMGHSPKNVSDRHYQDWEFIDPGESSQAVWDVMTGRVKLPKRRKTAQQMAYRMAYGDSGNEKSGRKGRPSSLQPGKQKWVNEGGGQGGGAGPRHLLLRFAVCKAFLP
ncbi:MAG: hypothetical protein M5U26_11585 [Planctomycetota bacterium]|nr:hypothetical protein [Planctomycetota bacterium]